MLRIRRVLAAFIFLVVVGVSVWIWSNLPQNPEELLNTLPENVDLALADLHYTHNEEGLAVWTLDAAEAKYQRQPGLADLAEVELVLHRTDGFGTVQVTADKGRFDQDSSRVEARGNVVLTSERGDKLYTEVLNYDVDKKLLSSAEPFRYLSQGVELTGIGLRVDVVSGRLWVESDVWTRYNPQQGPVHE
jgi:LPS export ABC transporter protein LptC